MRNAVPDAMAASSPSLDLTLYWVWSILFVLAVWASLLDTRRTAKLLPLVPIPRSGSWAPSSAPPLLQLVSKLNPFQAWLLGRVAEQLQRSVISEPYALDQAACILLGQASDSKPKANDQEHGEPDLLDPLLNAGSCSNQRERLPQLTSATLLDIGHLLKSRQGGALSRLAGVMSLANIIWVLGAVGVAIAFFPAAYPLLAWLGKVLGPVFIAIHKVLLPFYSLFCYTFCLYLIAVATRCTHNTAPYMAFTGATLAVATYIAFGIAFGQPDSPDVVVNMFTMSIHVFMMATYAPLTITYGSVLLGFGASAAFFALLGFVVIPIGLGLAIGWLDRYHMIQTGGAAAIITLLLLALRACRRASAMYPMLARLDAAARPFYPSLSVFGSICLFLSGLIMSSRWYEFAAQNYVRNNIVNLTVMLSVTAAGALLSDTIFSSTGVTFIVLWLIEKVVEFDGMSMWLSMLLVSAALVLGGGFLKSHPTWILSMLGADEGSTAAAATGL